ncbi:MAG: hypothetical protein LH606_22880 [Cytophagaceae bacterium]|nr:hypothetical protein [Cytophagaceae bacterium]
MNSSTSMSEVEIASEVLTLISKQDPQGSVIDALFREFTRPKLNRRPIQEDLDASDYERMFRKALIELQYTGLVSISALDVNTVKLTPSGRRAVVVGLLEWKQQEYEAQRQREEDLGRQIVSRHRATVGSWLSSLAALISLPISLVALMNSYNNQPKPDLKSLQDSIKVLNARVDSLSAQPKPINQNPAQLP